MLHRAASVEIRSRDSFTPFIEPRLFCLRPLLVCPIVAVVPSHSLYRDQSLEWSGKKIIPFHNSRGRELVLTFQGRRLTKPPLKVSIRPQLQRRPVRVAVNYPGV